MAYVKAPIPSEVYHLTKKKNLDSILEDGKIRRFDDAECWFGENLDNMKAYMEQTVMCEGKPYYAVGGRLCYYPKFVPEDYVLLKLTPCRREGNWYRWDQVVPPDSPRELVKVAQEFSQLKIGYRGDLAFKGAEIIDVPQFILDGTVDRQPVQTYGELWEQLRQSVERSHDAYLDSLYRMTSAQLINNAAEIEANRICYNALLTHDFERAQLEQLVSMDDPLKTMRDGWVSAQEENQEQEETFSHVLVEICNALEQRQSPQMTL